MSPRLFRQPILIVGSLLLHASVAGLVLAPSRITPAPGAAAGLVQVRLLSGQPEQAIPLQAPVIAPDVTDPSGPRVAQAESASGNTAGAVSGPSDADTLEPVFLPSAIMERGPTPVSAPDLQRIAVKPVSGLPIRLRIYVAASGQVARVEELSVSAPDKEFALSVAAMFEETLFLPGRRDGQDQHSYLDIELLAE